MIMGIIIHSYMGMTIAEKTLILLNSKSDVLRYTAGGW
jgi:hypothetical protein